MAEEKMKLLSMFGSYPNTRALKGGEIKSELVEFDFVEVKTANNFFKPLVRDAKFDFSELAIVTYLQARAFGKPYVLLPAVIVGRGQHHTIAYNPDRIDLKPENLEGKRVGVRAYTVTTGVWIRGILQEEYGVDPTKVNWITFEDPHVAEFQDPSFVKRAPEGKTMTDMLLNGELDAAVVGDHIPDPRLKHLIPDANAASQKWARSHGGISINHMAVIRESIARSRPDIVKETFRMLHESKMAAGLADQDPNSDPYRYGLSNVRQTLDTIIDYAFKQSVIPRRLSVDELFSDATRDLMI